MSLFGSLRTGRSLPVESHAPGFEGATGWLNSAPLTRTELQGHVVLADFWTYTCINWLRTLGYVRAWAAKYAGQGLVVVGVHTPEFRFEHDVANVRRAVEDLAVTYPVALDNDYAVWGAFRNRYWPALYIVDPEGRIRHHQFGEGGYEESEGVIQQLLREFGGDDVAADVVTVVDDGFEAQADWATLESPETYLGHQQAQNFVAGDPDRLHLNQWSLAGDWNVEPGAIVLNAAGGKIRFRFHARDVNLVLRAAAGAVRFGVQLDGAVPGGAHGLDVDEGGRGTLVEPRLYQLIRQTGTVEDRTLEIGFESPGVEAYAFTFG